MPKDDVILQDRYAIEAYISKNGYICLKQLNPATGEAIILMLPSDIPVVVKRLRELEAEFPLPEDD